jgi:hypothetical protein
MPSCNLPTPNMLIHSLIAVRLDEQEGLFYPIGSEHALKPFQSGGLIAFMHRFYTDEHYRVSILHAKVQYQGGLITEIKVWGIENVIALTHRLAEYLEGQIARYTAQDLPFDLAKESR